MCHAQDQISEFLQEDDVGCDLLSPLLVEKKREKKKTFTLSYNFKLIMNMKLANMVLKATRTKQAPYLQR